MPGLAVALIGKVALVDAVQERAGLGAVPWNGKIVALVAAACERAA